MTFPVLDPEVHEFRLDQAKRMSHEGASAKCYAQKIGVSDVSARAWLKRNAPAEYSRFKQNARKKQPPPSARAGDGEPYDPSKVYGSKPGPRLLMGGRL